jgi:poly-gamma-glutamate synthesis protein (capsule biosynthesis protein)
LSRDADLSIVNAEAPISDGGRRFPLYKDYRYRAPARAADALAWAGIDVLDLANNHILDWGAEGLADTRAQATRVGMETVGAGDTPAEARRGLIATIGDVRIGVLAFCEKQLLWRLWVDQYARRGHPGVAALVDRDLAADLERLRPHVDVLIVLLHAGDNYAPPTPSTIAWSERAIELGADLVAVHHPHVAHPVAMHRGRPILLSLGNFVFGTPGHPDLEEGLLAILRIEQRKLKRVELIPIDVQNRRVAFRPALLDGDARDRALARLRAGSQSHGADVRIEAGRGIVEVPW